MKKFLIAATAALVLVAAAPRPADAFFFKHWHFKHFKHIKKPVAPKNEPRLGRTSQSWVPQYILAATSCSALFLWLEALHTSQTQHRELTQKEAWTTVGHCFLPVIGGHVLGSLAQQP